MKKYTVKLLAAAEKEVAEACEWYDEPQLGLGRKLLIEISIFITQITENPFAFNVRFSEKYRYAPLKVFPYLIVYRIDEDHNFVIVISVFHTSRNSQRF